MSEKRKTEVVSRNVLALPIDDIVQLENSRVKYDKADLAQLMTSLRQTGQLQPIGVRHLKSAKFGDAHYEVVFGNRRLIAAQKLGWTVIDAIVTDDYESNTDMLVANTVENVQRQELSVVEQGRVFEALRLQGLTYSEIAARVGVSTKKVKAAVDSFMHIPRELRDRIRTHAGVGLNEKAGRVSESLALHATNMIRETLGLDEEGRKKIFDYALADETTTRDMRLLSIALRRGVPVDEAISRVRTHRHITVEVYMHIDVIAKIEQETGDSVRAFLVKLLKGHPELELADMPSAEAKARDGYGRLMRRPKLGESQLTMGDD
jgi:ParB/RepB/Spo0J family partition protein